MRLYALLFILVFALLFGIYEDSGLEYFLKRKVFDREIRMGRNPKTPIRINGTGSFSVKVEDLIRTKAFKDAVQSARAISKMQPTQTRR